MKEQKNNEQQDTKKESEYENTPTRQDDGLKTIEDNDTITIFKADTENWMEDQKPIKWQNEAIKASKTGAEESKEVNLENVAEPDDEYEKGENKMAQDQQMQLQESFEMQEDIKVTGQPIGALGCQVQRTQEDQERQYAQDQYMYLTAPDQSVQHVRVQPQMQFTYDPSFQQDRWNQNFQDQNHDFHCQDSLLQAL